MRAMVLRETGKPLMLEERASPSPGPGEIRVAVEACAVCRTDLHVVDGELPNPRLPVIPGHEIVGRVEAIGAGVSGRRLGERVGIPWLGHTCGRCPYCASGHENLCDEPLFTGYTRDGGFASHVVADADYAFALPDDGDPVALAPLLCAGLIGWRSLAAAGPGERIGIYGFGAAAHIITQVCTWQGRRVFAFTRREMSMRKTSPAPSVPCGPAPRTRRRPRRSMRRSSSRPWAILCRWLCGPCGRAAGSSAAGST